MNSEQELKIVKFDRRALTSPQNGLKGGRPAIPILAIVEAFIAKYYHDGKLCLRTHKGNWYVYRKGKYVQVHKRDIQSELIAFIQGNHCELKISRSLINDVMMNLESFSFCGLSSEFEIPCWLPNGKDAGNLFVMANCMVDIEKLATTKTARAKIIKPHDSDLFTTIAVPYNYDPKAKCPKWMKYLKRVQLDPKVRDAIQMMFGLALVPDTRYEVAFFLYGEGGTGKTVCLHVLTNLVGEQNVCCIPLSRFGNRFGLHGLSTSLLNIVGDLPTAGDRASLAHVEGIFKDVVSGGMIPVEKKFQDSFMAKSIARNVFAANSLPMFSDRSNAIWERLRIIPFNEVIRGTGEDNKNLKNELVQEELPGIFNWAVKGLAKLRTMQLFPETPEGIQIKAEHREMCDMEGNFLRDNFEYDPNCECSTVYVYSEYQVTMRENGYRAAGMSKLADAVRRVFPKVFKVKCTLEDGRRVHVWCGLKSLQVHGGLCPVVNSAS